MIKKGDKLLVIRLGRDYGNTVTASTDEVKDRVIKCSFVGIQEWGSGNKANWEVARFKRATKDT